MTFSGKTKGHILGAGEYARKAWGMHEGHWGMHPPPTPVATPLGSTDLILFYRIWHNLVIIDQANLFVLDSYCGPITHGLTLIAPGPGQTLLCVHLAIACAINGTSYLLILCGLVL